MAQLLHHQESTFYGNELHGSKWSILQFFGFRRHLRSTKMISDKKHSQGKGSGGSRRRSSYVPLKEEDSGVMEDEKYTEVTKKNKASKKSFGKGRLGSLILKKLYGKEGQKEKMLPVAPKLLRTLSIHYLESNEYVLDGETATNGDGSSESTTLSMQNTTNTNFHRATLNAQDGCDNDTSSLLLKSDDGHVKRKSHRSISMDGVLHKVPYGQKVSGDVIREELSRSASATYDRDGLKPCIGTAGKRPVNQGFRRSRSLTESLERYSHLLDSISSSQSKRTLTSSKSSRDHSTGLRRTLAESRSISLVIHSESLVIQEDTLASHVKEKTVVDGDVHAFVDEISSDEVADGSDNTAFLEDYMNDKRCVAAVSAEANLCTVPLPSEGLDISEEHAATCDDEHVHSSKEVDLCAAHSTAEEVDVPEEHGTTSDGNHISSSTEAGMCTTLSSENGSVAEEQTATSDVLESREDSSLMPRIVHDTDNSADMVLNASTSMELSATELTGKNVQESDFDELNYLQADPKNGDELICVKDIFMRSSFCNEILFDEWCTQNITALQEEDCQHYEAAAAAFDFTDMSADQLLLFDLTNEVLLDIYTKYSDHKSKLSWPSSLDRPKPVGNHALKQLWSKVSCHLDEQTQPGTEIDTILSNDLTKSDRWVNFQRHADHLGNKLADFVLDKLLTELTLQLAEF
ncbi:hypothetical protein GUJ93_ZPchr0008g11632 [Zizania palustris]|uniref:DUF4378 domain-containing protein n=1 Tax=Zizania palustris TaxID=103762 RepID=A0A8J5RG46_ZIZPA|nr:hypothetical protein GUJ93_ZPchr0008g11632 [Zizania palustris]KAG8046084.1 hypothetical protein GUJ93_ZPchr0008g11632 [Zizania palustris]KAG8046087.1 hypothetical protein GUJ93_ZPchr0008g11632 [Zizania palustris]